MFPEDPNETALTGADRAAGESDAPHRAKQSSDAPHRARQSSEPSPDNLLLYRRPDSRFEYEPDEPDHPPKQRLWLHILLFIATLISTTLVGAQLMFNFRYARFENPLDLFSFGFTSPAAFASGLPFSLTLLAILMAHEMGHYLACVWYGVDATLPFFIPFPLSMTGTLGAFIRIRSHIPTKRVLFDIGAAGPLAGFIFLAPALFIGLADSRVVPGIANRGDWILGVPALQWLAQAIVFPGVRSADICLHPMARAAWVGMLATALNMLPAGQLDGGHIVYAILGRAHKWVTGMLLIALLPLAWFSWAGWLMWSVLIFFLARRHPPIYDETPIGPGRMQTGALSLVIFLLCFTPAPANGSLQDLLRELHWIR